ncbi:MAG: hypothetical protein ACK40U_10620, partial [Fervidobacterium pennivorans]
WWIRGYRLKSYEDRWESPIPLIGVGLSSYSYVGEYEWKNTKQFEEYEDALSKGMVPWSEYCLLSPITSTMRRFKYRLFLEETEVKWLREAIPAISNLLDDEKIFEHNEHRWALTRLGIPLIEEIINCVVKGGGNQDGS